MTKGFYIDDVEHTVTVVAYTDGYPATTNCDPDEGHEGADWDITFDGTVDVDTGDSMFFEDFIDQYAKEHYKGDSQKALAVVENDCRLEMMEQGNDYSP